MSSEASATHVSDKENGMEERENSIDTEQLTPQPRKRIKRQEIYDPEQDKNEKRALRKDYRNLIISTEENRQDYLKSNSNGLSETLAKANSLYKKVRNTHEAILDSRILVLSADLSVQKARRMKIDSNAFDTDDYVGKLVNFMGGSQPHLEEEDDAPLDWLGLGKVAARFTTRVPSMAYMLGPLSIEQKERTKGKSQVRIEKNEKDLRTPISMKEQDIERQENETTRNVKMIADFIQERQPINLFEFIINPESFSQTIENLFYLSFLVRDGQVSIDDEDGQPIITRCESATAEDYENGLIKKQVVLEMDMALWKQLIEVYEIKKSIIPTRVKKEYRAGKWYGGGSLYLFSLYGPQLGKELAYKQVELSFVGSTGNNGLYLMGPLTGWFLDKYGPRWSCILAAICIFSGYTLMGFTYNHILPNSSFILMATYYGLVGAGLSFSCMAALNVVAKNFEKHRGTALGIPSAFFGLSAFLLSQYSEIFLVDSKGRLDVFKLLLSLGIAFGIANIISTAWLRIIPSRVEEEVIVDINGNEQTPLLTPSNTAITTYNNSSLNTNTFISDPSAWLLFFSFFFLSGTGLMVINAIGTIIVSLVLASNPSDSLVTTNPRTSQLQSFHVSLISIASCLGRISMGIASDYYKLYHGTSRLIFWLIAAIIMLCSQLYAAFGLALLDSAEKALSTLWILSIGTGFTYGTFFSLGPTITSELWGLPRFGINWGTMILAPAVGGLSMNLVFGILYDYYAKKQSIGDDFDEVRQCRGVECFQMAFYVSSFICLVGILLAWVLFVRNQRVISL
ncbi:6477_t:CDS:10 [Ambispora leptoticha]|uniref:Non-structural maintenance of chromosomes element 4 n=1 Tax=Ambispora leptoticha TaxID=144679 RepID=A0A9N8V3T7_9GLOM|nr:6477_t:CDS:10 [Ambispora leptoticha]